MVHLQLFRCLDIHYAIVQMIYIQSNRLILSVFDKLESSSYTLRLLTLKPNQKVSVNKILTKRGSAHDISLGRGRIMQILQ
jgi:hypothetical protein